MNPWRPFIAAVVALFVCPPLLASEVSEAWAARVERARRDYEMFAARGWEHFAARHAEAFAAHKGPPPPNYADDATLRRGDLVMTDRGLLVFAGVENGQARFKAFNDWRGDSPHRAHLLELDKAGAVPP